MKRLVGVLALALCAVPVATASAQAPDLRVKESGGRVKVVGPGFVVKMTKHGIRVRIDDERFGDPSAGFPIQRSQRDLATVPNLRQFVCENGTYRLVSGIFDVTQRASSTVPRPAPFPDRHNQNFPISTFVGIVDGTVVNERGETLRLLVTDVVHEVLTEDSFSGTYPVHGFIVDSKGRVRDRASLVGLFDSDRTGEDVEHLIIDRGTCRQTANLGPGAEQAIVFGPFFVHPFNSRLVRLPPRKPWH